MDHIDMTNTDLLNQLAAINHRLYIASEAFQRMEDFREYDRMSEDMRVLYRTVHELVGLQKELVVLIELQTMDKLTNENPLL